MKETFDRYEYLNFVINEIEKRRNQSIENFCKTDIYTKEDIYDVIKLFETVIEKLKCSPPEGYISKLIITDDSDTDKVLIDYDYTDVAVNDLEMVII